MSANKQYGEQMSKAVKGLIDNHTHHKATGTVTFDTSKLEHPEGITTETLATHVNYINDLTGQTEQAVAELARNVYADNNELRTLDGTLDFGAFSIKSQHHLSQNIGDDVHYGQSTTIVDYVHSGEQSQWLEQQRLANQSEAAKLFG